MPLAAFRVLSGLGALRGPVVSPLASIMAAGILEDLEHAREAQIERNSVIRDVQVTGLREGTAKGIHDGRRSLRMWKGLVLEIRMNSRDLRGCKWWGAALRGVYTPMIVHVKLASGSSTSRRSESHEYGVVTHVAGMQGEQTGTGKNRGGLLRVSVMGIPECKSLRNLWQTASHGAGCIAQLLQPVSQGAHRMRRLAISLQWMGMLHSEPTESDSDTLQLLDNIDQHERSQLVGGGRCWQTPVNSVASHSMVQTMAKRVSAVLQPSPAAPMAPGYAAAAVDRARDEAVAALASSGVLGGGIRLNREQLAAIGMCLQRPPLALVFGPPGTGKTSTLSAFLAHALCSPAKPRVLVVSQTNMAADVLLARLLRLVLEAGDSKSDLSQTGSSEVLRVAGFMRTLQHSVREMGESTAKSIWALTLTGDVPMDFLASKRVVVSTLNTASKWLGNIYWALSPAALVSDAL